MSPIDDDGYLFGRVNVIDAAVVLLVLVGMGAGVLVLNPFADQGDPATRYATIDLGEQPRTVAERVDIGDVSAGDRSTTNLTITDTYVGPAGPGNATVVVRARITGTVADGGSDDPGLSFRGERLQRGDDLDVETGSYDVEGRILELGSENRSVATGSLSVVIETNVSAATAAQIDPGDTHRIDETTVATVEETVIAPTGATGNHTALVGMSLATYENAGDTYFGDTRVAVGRDLAVRTDRYDLSGSVIEWGNVTPPGEVVNSTAVVKLPQVDPDVADDLETGMVERHDGRTYAQITDTRNEPATVVLESEDGNIYARDHPVDRDVYLTLDLRTRRTEEGLRFHVRPLREGANVSLDFGTIRTRGTVVDLDS